MESSDDETERRRALAKIARALGVSLDTFVHASPGDRTNSAAEEEAELLHLFRQIRDARTRMQCLGHLRALARPSGEG